MPRAGLAVLLLLAGTACTGDGSGAGDPPRSRPLVIESRFLGRTLEQRVVDSGPGRGLLVLLHGRGGSPSDFLTRELKDALERAGDGAPSILLVAGGDHSYYHNRRDGRWADYVLKEAIPEALRNVRADPEKLAIGGFSMGGYGALSLARLGKGWCAVGGHAPALWRSGGETPAGAFDDAEDFARNDVFAWAASRQRPYGQGSVWLDVGTADPFRPATVAFARLLRARGQRPKLHVWPGGHSHAYLRAHLDEYVAFYAAALARCRG
jgi:S-formylglutathione hydrolase FrmB